MWVSITGSVGVGGVNRPDVVRAVQRGLNDLPPGAGGPTTPLAVDGIAGSHTRGAITGFQKANLGLVADGRVDRNGATNRMINARLDANAMARDPKALALATTAVSDSWARFALTAIRSKPFEGNTRAALDTHFHLSAEPRREAEFIATIQANYERVLDVFKRGAILYRSRNDTEAASDRGVGPDGEPFPAYTFFASSINFTRNFAPRTGNAGFGPMCLAAMVLHEPVHFVDQRANVANDFYEHGPQYASLTPTQALHNPSSYVCFAEQIVFGSDVRFGAGKPEQ
jgi:peptidoglycan hydrolase-like protein with peptidoglycan-binding domain